MKLAVVGSRNIKEIDLAPYTEGVTEIISGGARGVDTLAAAFAIANGIRLTEITPNYERYGRGAPIKRNYEIVDSADRVVVFWDGQSRGSQSVIKYAEKIGKPCQVVLCQ